MMHYNDDRIWSDATWDCPEETYALRCPHCDVMRDVEEITESGACEKCDQIIWFEDLYRDCDEGCPESGRLETATVETRP